MLNIAPSESSYDDESEVAPSRFENVELISVIQNCKIFNDVPLNPLRCTKVVMDLLYLIYTGRGNLSEDEATEIFFMSTKLMQSSDPRLRRLHYVLLKELTPKVEASYVAANSLMVDLKSPSEVIRRNALRTLFCVTDPSFYDSLVRAILENLSSPTIGSAASVIAIHLATINLDMAKKTFSTFTFKTDSYLNLQQYLQLALMHMIRSNKFISAQRIIETNNLSPQWGGALAVKICEEQLMQIVAKNGYVTEEGSKFLLFIQSAAERETMCGLQSWMALCSIPHLKENEVLPCVHRLFSVLQPWCISGWWVPALKLLSKLSYSHPMLLHPYSANLELLAGNQSPATAAGATLILLRTGSEASIEQLLKKFTEEGKMEAMGDDLKCVLIDGALSLHEKFPSMINVISDFLIICLGEVESALTKQRVVDVMMRLSKRDPSTKENFLVKLADCIDDCEFPALTKRILALLGDEVPQSTNPRRYIRYIYNHCKLEQASIRAAAVRTLAKIASKLPEMRPLIVPLIAHCCADEDDEVRDRAVFYTKLFHHQDETFIQRFVAQIGDQVAAHRQLAVFTPGADAAGIYGAAACEASTGTLGSDSRLLAGSPASAGGGVFEGRDMLSRVAPLASLGTLLRSCEPLSLTEEDNDYVVTVCKHLTAKHIIFQFRIRNTLENVSLVKVNVSCGIGELEGAQPEFAIPAPRIAPGSTDYAYFVLSFEEDTFPYGEITSHISFGLEEEGEALGDDVDLEEFQLEAFDVDVSDFLSPLPLEENFEELWEAYATNETVGTYELQSMQNLTVGVHEIASFFGLYVVGGGVPEKVKEASYTLRMSGTAADPQSSKVLMKAKVFFSTAGVVVLQLGIRGGSEYLRNLLTKAVLA